MCLQTNRVRDHPSIECALLPCNNQASTTQAYDTDGSGSSSRSFLGYNTHSIRIGQLLANAVHHQFDHCTTALLTWTYVIALHTNVRFFRRPHYFLWSIKVERVKVKLSTFKPGQSASSLTLLFTTTTTINSFFFLQRMASPSSAPRPWQFFRRPRSHECTYRECA